MKYVIEFDLPDNDTVLNNIKTAWVGWNIWGFSGIAHAKPKHTERKKGKWIPVSERLPDDSRQVLVYARNVHFALAKYDEMREADGTYKKQWVTFDAWKPFYKIKDVIAWMPLPEPYRGRM